jgi:hypothetical protein
MASDRGVVVKRLKSDLIKDTIRYLERIMNAKAKSLKGIEEYLIEMTRIR